MVDANERFEREFNENQENHRRLTEKIHDLERKNENHQSTIRELREAVHSSISVLIPIIPSLSLDHHE